MKIKNKVFTIIIFCISITCFSKFKEINCKKSLIIQKEKIAIDLEESIIIGNKIIKYCNNDSIKAHAYSIRGIAYSNKGDYINAFKDAFKAKNLFNLKRHNIREITYNNIFLSNIYKRIGLTDNAFQELNETLKFIKKNDPENYILISSIYISEGNIFINIQKPNEALSYFLEAEKNLKKIKNPKYLENKNKTLSIVYSDISNVYLSSNDYINAEKFINKAIKILGSKKYFDIDYINTITLAEILSGTNREEKAIELLLPLKDNPNIEPIFKQFIFDLLSRSYDSIGDVEKAKMTRKKAESIKYIFQQQKTEGLKEAYKYVENELIKNKKEKLTTKIILFGSIISFLVIILIIIKVFVNKIKLEKKNYHTLIESIENNKKKPTVDKKRKKDIEYTHSELLLLEKLETFEVNKGFLNNNLTLAVLAVELNTNTHYLSEIINKAKSKNINTYINELRINYIVNELYNKPELLSYKISYIAELAGFNSHNSFSIVFKKITNISPSTFLEERRKVLCKK